MRGRAQVLLLSVRASLLLTWPSTPLSSSPSPPVISSATFPSRRLQEPRAAEKASLFTHHLLFFGDNDWSHFGAGNIYLYSSISRLSLL